MDTSFRYLIQRIENTLNYLDPSSRFMIITDPGRVGKMRATSRRIQRINFIPVKGEAGRSYRREIKRLIEDPLPKDSDQSYFIQISDLISFIAYHYIRNIFSIGDFPKRTPVGLNDQKIIDWLNILDPVLNKKATREDPFGIVCYPKP